MTTKRARHLRSHMTDAELRLWSALRRRQLDGQRFRRQVPLGRFVVDFACYDARLVVEVDGGQHGERQDDDAARTDWLESKGFRVLRFWSDEVLENLEGVLAAIREAVAAYPPPQSSPTRGEDLTKACGLSERAPSPSMGEGRGGGENKGRGGENDGRGGKKDSRRRRRP